MIFRGLIERLDDEEFTKRLGVRPGVAKRPFAPVAMTDHGDHVEWTDGARTWRWRLPDQADTGAGYPVMATVLMAGFRSQATGRPGLYRIRFMSADGSTLGRFAGKRRSHVNAGIVDRILPETAFETLRERGVAVTRESYTWPKHFFDAHPDPDVTGFKLSLARHPILWQALVLFVILAVAVAIRFG
ncbi:MAG: hypothetical protein M3R71_02310 [Actinomycetota bacterium]|nr:hypothetical protein [Actinomycetota bacterium]